MSKSDVEMEDGEKLLHDSGQNLQESENKAINANIEEEEQNLGRVDAVSGDKNKRENGEEDVNTCHNEDKGDAEVEDQTNPKSESNESIERSNGEEISMKYENKNLVDSKNVDGEKPSPKSVIEKQVDRENEVVQQDITIGREKEQKSSDSNLDSEIHLKDITEKPKDDVEEKRPKELGKEDADCVKHVAQDKTTIETINDMSDASQNRQLPTELSTNKDSQAPSTATDAVPQGEVEGMDDSTNSKEDKSVKDDMEKRGADTVLGSHEKQENAMTVETAMKHDQDSLIANQQEPATPTSLVRDSSSKAGDYSGETVKSVFTLATLPPVGENDDGTPEEQAAFMKEIESFYCGRAMDFKPPKFYGQPLNCLKLWRAVIRLGGYDRVTGAKLWRQVGESFHPPKTCTTVSWTFRIFYEKSLLEYERHKTQSGELQLPATALSEVPGVEVEGNSYQGSGPGRARRDAAARAMQGWHAQRLSDYGEVGEPIIKDKNSNNVTKRERNLKNIGSVKQKRPSEAEHSNKAARTEISKQLATPIVDVGPPADWVKINVRQTKDCFEIYALVPGLLREEVRVQSDPAGRVVITGQPEQVDNPWGITPFRKVVSLPGRIDPLQTSAVVSLHGRLLIRVPFESSNI